MKRGKKIKEARGKVDKSVLYSVEDAVNMMKELKYAPSVNPRYGSEACIQELSGYPRLRGSSRRYGRGQGSFCHLQGDKQSGGEGYRCRFRGGADAIAKIRAAVLDFQL
jgi:hypothetical protein